METANFEDIYAAKKYLKQIERAKQKGFDFNLSLSEFKRIISRKTCFYTGVKMNKPIGENSKDFHDLTLDRIDSSKGYITGNVVACTRAANNLKAIWENPEFKMSVEDARNVALKTIELLSLNKEKNKV